MNQTHQAHCADVTSSAQPMIDLWHVQLSNGETRRLSLDELDAGFNAGWISVSTPVLAAGATQWKTLGEVAGLDETPPPVSSMPNSIAPLALDNFGPGSAAGDIPIDVNPSDLDDAEVAAFRPRRGRKVFAFMTVTLLIAGLGFAGFRARPAVQRALTSRAAAKAAVNAPATPPPAAAVIPVIPVTPAAAAAPVAAAPPVSTAAALPNAASADKEKDKKAKRALQKRAK